jgi:hypothetical protein
MNLPVPDIRIVERAPRPAAGVAALAVLRRGAERERVLRRPNVVPRRPAGA